MNVLVTSIGSLAAKFVIEQCKLNFTKVFGIDMNEEKHLINSIYLDDFFQVSLSIDQASYYSEIMGLVKNNEINCIVPLTDVDIDFYSTYKHEFEELNIKVLVDDFAIVQILRNKESVYQLFKSNSIINCIPSYDSNSFLLYCNQYPAVAKIKNGRSSIDLKKITHPSELALLNSDYIVQPFILGAVVTVDILSTDEGTVWIQRKELFRTSNGAGITVEIINNDKINQSVKEFLLKTHYKGILNIEFILTSDVVYLMDVNPRFSAGVAFSNFAGYNFVSNAFLFLQNKKIGLIEKELPIGMLITKEYSEVII